MNDFYTQNVCFARKANYAYVKYLSKQRRGVIDDALMMILTCFPSTVRSENLTKSVVDIVETFFLEDHVVEEIQSPKKKRARSRSTSKTKYLPEENHIVKSRSITKRASANERASEVQELDEMGKKSQLILHDETREKTDVKTVNVSAKTYDDPLGINRHVIPFVMISCTLFHFLSEHSITIGLDLVLFVSFVFFCIGSNATSSSNKSLPTPNIKKTHPLSKMTSFHNHELIRKSMSDSGLSIVDNMTTLLPMLPKGADFNLSKNCISLPRASDFLVRGSKYLFDRKKVQSNDFLLPLRGVELFLTDACPENVGSNHGVFDGELRDSPTFIINFRLPWGVFIIYFDIPDKFLPFMRKKYVSGNKINTPSKKTMSPGERTFCRYLLGDNKQKDSTLKLIPRVMEGPWIVKSVVGKPAIIGNKLPINYVYKPADKKKGYSEYLELDLDIVSSAAGRKILSVCRSYTETLTLDLGFVIQGNATDELPEQMLGAIRIHSLNPMIAPPFPPMKTMWENLSER